MTVVPFRGAALVEQNTDSTDPTPEITAEIVQAWAGVDKAETEAKQIVHRRRDALYKILRKARDAHPARGTWTAYFTAYVQPVVRHSLHEAQKILRDYAGGNPELAAAARNRKERERQRAKRAAKKQAETTNTSVVGRVTAETDTNPVETAKAAVKALDAGELATFMSWFSGLRSADVSRDERVTFVRKVAEGLGFKSRPLHNGAVVEFRDRKSVV